MTVDDLLNSLKGRIVVGIDEVGRGCWAGPMVVGAVILDSHIAGLNDSKLIAKASRESLAASIKFSAIAWATGWVTASEIDELGLTAATSAGIRRALASMPVYENVIIDGSINYLPSDPKAFNLIKADQIVPAVSAASIIAKCARDEYMFEQSKLFPEYGFDAHVGYGTARHRQALADHGVTPLHRRSYKPVRAILDHS